MLKPFHLARLREIVRSCVPFINHDGQIFVSMPGRLHGGARVVEINDDPGDSSSPENPPKPSPDFDVPPQPTETEEVKS